MNILLTGAQGVGKTTLRTKIRSYLPHLIETPGVTRSLIEEGVISKEEMNKSTTPASQTLIFNKYCQIHREYKDVEYINDRCCLDALAYTLYMLEHNDENKYDLYYKQYEEVVKLIKEGYINYIYYLPIEFNITGDSIRDDDKDFQVSIDNNIRFIITELIRDTEVNIYEITGSLEERVNNILNIYNKDE